MHGIDLSLTATGVAHLDENGKIVTRTLYPGNRLGRERRDWIADRLFHLVDSRFCIEGLSYGSNMPSSQERAALWFRVVDDFEREGCQVIVCPPKTLKKFVSRKGTAEKGVMIREVFRLWQVEATNDNEADAAGLLQVGRAVIGDIPDSELTTPQREVVAMLKRKKAA